MRVLLHMNGQLVRRQRDCGDEYEGLLSRVVVVWHAVHVGHI